MHQKGNHHAAPLVHLAFDYAALRVAVGIGLQVGDSARTLQAQVDFLVVMAGSQHNGQKADKLA